VDVEQGIIVFHLTAIVHQQEYVHAETHASAVLKNDNLEPNLSKYSIILFEKF
jgi:hypothetical protein